jgi:putative hydrolase of the HAD superfamily
MRHALCEPNLMSVDSNLRDIQAVVFDAVGTLIEAVPSVADVYAAVAERQGLAIDRKTIKALFHHQFHADESDGRPAALMTNEATERARWRRIVAGVLPDLPDLDRGFQELWEHFGRPRSWRCFPDVGPALSALERAGLPVRVASNFDARLRPVVLGLPAMAGLSDMLLISSEFGVRKPHPDFYVAACSNLGLPPHRVLWVGDDPENDVRGPRRAGLIGLHLDRLGMNSLDLPRTPDLNTLITRLLG